MHRLQVHQLPGGGESHYVFTKVVDVAREDLCCQYRNDLGSCIILRRMDIYAPPPYVYKKSKIKRFRFVKIIKNSKVLNSNLNSVSPPQKKTKNGEMMVRYQIEISYLPQANEF